MEGLPTIDELKLIFRLSSNLNNTELKEIIKKLPTENIVGGNKVYKYVLVKVGN